MLHSFIVNITNIKKEPINFAEKIFTYSKHQTNIYLYICKNYIKYSSFIK